MSNTPHCCATCRDEPKYTGDECLSELVKQASKGICPCWQPKQQKPYFADAKVGDEVYSLNYGLSEIVSVQPGCLVAEPKDNSRGDFQFYLDGKTLCDAEQTVFWSKPEIIAPPKPKRKREFHMRKTIYLKRVYTPTEGEKIYTTTERNDSGEILDRILIDHSFRWEEYMEKFKVGEWGEWESQAQGRYKRKVAECMAIVPAGVRAWSYFEKIGGWAKFSPQFGGWVRNHDSYLFATKPGPRGGKRKLYCPRVKGLKKVAPPSDSG